ncbi:YhcN/YlaJ family sporulation lipoprotein [Gracilibacillus marinus]|uniref:YhcN/YlaJ family sporulation lipoprotein n=1 Tax=Gracilibacillus marinus TaxID=630535 RepID=A0ABV8VS29_9BACI
MYKLIIFLLLLMLSVGCQQEEDHAQSAKEKDSKVVQISNSNQDPTIKPLNNEEKAQYLANLASSIPNVDNATALITNRGVIVGIDVDDQLDRSHVGSIKYSVLEAMQHDPHGADAIVVADPDIYERLKGMGDKIQQGHPIDAITDELANITGRLIPEFPLDENKEKNIDENKQILDDKEKKELEEITDEQSNHQKDR